MSDTKNNNKTVSIDLRNGSTVTGALIGYRSAALVFQTAAGEVAVPFYEIPADLQRVFANDPTVMAMAAISEIQTKLEARFENTASLLNTINEHVSRLLVENKTLWLENEQLRARLSEFVL